MSSTDPNQSPIDSLSLTPTPTTQVASIDEFFSPIPNDNNSNIPTTISTESIDNDDFITIDPKDAQHTPKQQTSSITTNLHDESSSSTTTNPKQHSAEDDYCIIDSSHYTNNNSQSDNSNSDDDGSDDDTNDDDNCFGINAYLDDFRSESPCIYNIIREKECIVVDTSYSHTLDCPVSAARTPMLNEKVFQYYEKKLKREERAKRRQKRQIEKQIRYDLALKEKQRVTNSTTTTTTNTTSTTTPDSTTLLLTGNTVITSIPEDGSDNDLLHTPKNLTPTSSLSTNQPAPISLSTQSTTTNPFENDDNDSTITTNNLNLSQLSTTVTTPSTILESPPQQQHEQGQLPDSEGDNNTNNQDSPSSSSPSTISTQLPSSTQSSPIQSLEIDITTTTTPTTGGPRASILKHQTTQYSISQPDDSPLTPLSISSNSQRDSISDPFSPLSELQSPTALLKELQESQLEIAPLCTCGGGDDLFSARQCSVEHRAEFIKQALTSDPLPLPPIYPTIPTTISPTNSNSKKLNQPTNNSTSTTSSTTSSSSTTVSSMTSSAISTISNFLPQRKIAPTVIAPPQPSPNSILPYENPNPRPHLLKVYSISWNLYGCIPETFTHVLPPSVFDIYIISLQECGTVSAALMGTTHTYVMNMLLDAIGSDPDEYTLIASTYLQTINTYVFIRTPLIAYVHGITKEVCATGYADMFGNKGAAAVRFFLGTTSICTIGAHFNSGQSSLEKRNQDYHKIAGRLTLGLNDCVVNTLPNSIFPYQNFRNTFRSTSLSAHGYSAIQQQYKSFYTNYSDIGSRSDVTFWLGDLNYRVHGTRKSVEDMLAFHRHFALLHLDQLRSEKDNGVIFYGFREGVIGFPPTYKYDPHKQCFDTSNKQRIPSWTDRILIRDNCTYCCHQRLVCDCASQPCLYGHEQPNKNNNNNKNNKNNINNNNNNNIDKELSISRNKSPSVSISTTSTATTTTTNNNPPTPTHHNNTETNSSSSSTTTSSSTVVDGPAKNIKNFGNNNNANSQHGNLKQLKQQQQQHHDDNDDDKFKTASSFTLRQFHEQQKQQQQSQQDDGNEQSTTTTTTTATTTNDDINDTTPIVEMIDPSTLPNRPTRPKGFSLSTRPLSGSKSIDITNSTPSTSSTVSTTQEPSQLQQQRPPPIPPRKTIPQEPIAHNCKRLLLEKYGCIQTANDSDHKPVYAHFILAVKL